MIYIRRGDIPALKRQALVFAESRCEYFAKLYGVTFKKITIRAQKARWGSCSLKGSLSFNYKISALPEHIADYIIVHEIVHLKVFNHSRAFWDTVAQTVPNHKDIRRELKNIRFVHT